MNNVIETFRHYRERRHAARQLSAMPDYLLNDIGVERGNIEAVVNGLQARRSAVNGAQQNHSGRHLRELAMQR